MEQELSIIASIAAVGNITGILDTTANLDAVIDTTTNITAQLDTSLNVVGEIDLGGSALYPEYTGETVVTPSVLRAQTLNTSQTVVEDDITVTKIPYIETSNISGITVYIGDLNVNE